MREFTFGHVRQLGAVARRFLVKLAGATPLLGGAEAVTFVDVDSLLRRVYGRAKQGAGFGHAKVGGYGVLLRGLALPRLCHRHHLSTTDADLTHRAQDHPK